MKGVVNDSITRKANVDNSDNSIGVTVNPVAHVQVCYNCKIHEFTLIELILTEFIYFDPTLTVCISMVFSGIKLFQSYI